MEMMEGIYPEILTLFKPPAHTISQRLRQLKKVPPELIPLGVVIGYSPSIQPQMMIRSQSGSKEQKANP
ncbi:hypothetical protein P167DRAFT_534864 [Morchella conica CCBAS932]|uniref:Uncharacterized protein n=1 Tax=Morchella conica CCBAS932 TaxID=1392247 RepID=A0A3N4KSC4_9PEZI|nr:hypothetical protein P167DRAFT_534864 [Morchella conica CCBAS932]